MLIALAIIVMLKKLLKVDFGFNLGDSYSGYFILNGAYKMVLMAIYYKR